MKILVLTSFFNKTGSEQIIFEFVNSLIEQGHQIKTIACESNIKDNDIYKLKLFGGINYRNLVFNKWYYRIQKIGLIFFRINLTSFFFKTSFRSLTKAFKNESFVPDHILLFTGGAFEVFLFNLTSRFSNYYIVTYSIHAFDPIPGTIEWGEKEIVRKAVIDVLTPYFKQAKSVSAISPRMTAYFKNSYLLEGAQMETVYMPIKYIGGGPKKSNKISFLYLGSIYGKRNPVPLFSALNQLFSDKNDIELILAGTGLRKIDLVNLYPNFKDRVNLIDYTDKPNELIQHSTILIDLNADIPGDVFISSKLMRYLGSNKPILVIGNRESASFDFSSKFSGIHFSINNEKEILKTVNHILFNKKNRTDRESEIKAYEVSKLASSLITLNPQGGFKKSRKSG